MFRIEVDDGHAQATVKEVKGKVSPGLPVRLWERIWRDQQAQAQMMFVRLPRGGTHRGEYWPPFAPQYTRKTDGVTVPAEGGVSRIDGEGVVKGRKRPSGQRIDATSNLMRDTGDLSRSAASVRSIRDRRRTLRITTPLDYAAPQQAMRPFMFFTQEDLRRYVAWVEQEIGRD